MQCEVREQGSRGAGAVVRRIVASASAIVVASMTALSVGIAPAAAANGSISGTVTAANGGAPLAGICVAAYENNAQDDVLVAATFTAGNGTYTLNLNDAPTNVDVKFYATGGCAGGVAQNFVPEWWDNAFFDDEATPVAVAPGVTGIDAALAAGATISGTVTAATGGGGIGGVCVAAYQPGGQDARVEVSTATAANGTYALTGVPAGSHLVRFYSYDTVGFCPNGATTNYVAEWWDNKVTEDVANTVTVNAGGTAANVNAALATAGTITGTVTAQSGGAPLNAICVAAYTHGVDPQQLVAAGSTRPNGTYDLKGVPAGDVDVQFYSYGGSGFCPGGLPSNYSAEWYDNKGDQSTANPVHVNAGQTTANIDAALGNGGTITGNVKGANNNANLVGICVRAYPNGGDTQIAVTGTLANGNYTLDGIPAGSVDVRFDASGGCPGGVAQNRVTEWYDDHAFQSAADAVTVTDGATTSGIDALLAQGGTITGTVTAGGTGRGGICVSAVEPLSEATFASIGTKANGTYTLTGVPAGTVKVSFNDDTVCSGGSQQANFSSEWFNNKTSIDNADNVTVTGGATTANVNGSLTGTPAFTTTVNGGTTTTIGFGSSAALAPHGLSATAAGTVVFNAPGHANLCTVNWPAQSSCSTSTSLPAGSYAPISAAFTSSNGNWTNANSSNTVSLSVVNGLPGAPTNVTAAKGNGGAVKVAWKAPASNGGSAITGYTVIASNGKTVNVGAATLSTTVTGLAPGKYTFRVRTKNAIGNSAFSLASNAVTLSAPARTGYWMLGSQGKVYAFGDAKNLGNASGSSIALTSRRDGTGYWVVDAAGRVSAFGAAKRYGSTPALRPGEIVSTIAATPSGKGYWLFTNLGNVFARGDAKFFGDMGAVRLNGPIVASTATPTGKGYYLIGSDGGVFTFGDAVFRGSTGNMRLNKPVVGMASTPDNRGYWLVASDGGVFAFNAPFRGSMGATPLNRPVNGLVAFGNGYLMVASDGGVFTFSDKPFLGSLGADPPPAPIIGIAAFTTG